VPVPDVGAVVHPAIHTPVTRITRRKIRTRVSFINFCGYVALKKGFDLLLELFLTTTMHLYCFVHLLLTSSSRPTKTGMKRTTPLSRLAGPSPSGRFPPLSKHHEIVRRVNALFRVRLRSSVVAASRSSRWRRSITTSQGRHHINRATRKNSEVMWCEPECSECKRTERGRVNMTECLNVIFLFARPLSQ